jgi:hypothetical protein
MTDIANQHIDKMNPIKMISSPRLVFFWVSDKLIYAIKSCPITKAKMAPHARIMVCVAE